jgi:hypothetical protein
MNSGNIKVSDSGISRENCYVGTKIYMEQTHM